MLCLAVELSASLVLIDERPARRLARERFRLPLCGTAGVLVRAKRLGLVPAVRPLMAEMKQRGYFLSERLIEKACRQVGE